MSPEEVWEKAQAKASAAGAKVTAVTPLAPILKEYPDVLGSLPGNFQSAIVIGVPLPSASLAGIVDSPTPLYFHHYRQVNYSLDRISLDIALAFEDEGFPTTAIPASQIISWKPVIRGHISHRLLGYYAGLGWRGRNNLLVNPQYGSQIRYASVLTEARMGEEISPMPFSCGSCHACAAVCPAKAVKERPEDFDLNACSAKLSEFAKMPFLGQRICGVCVKACTTRRK